MATSARFGSVAIGEPGLTVRMDARETGLVALVDQVTKQFRGGAFQRGMSSAHRDMAQRVQDAQAAELDRRIEATGRPQRGTNYLAISILDERNVDVTATAYAVGRPSWLDRSPARLYWRNLEEGGQGYTTSALFSNNNGRPWKPYFRPSADMLNLRMPQGRGVTIDVAGTPEYAYLRRGGRKAMRNMSTKAIYSEHLLRYGIRLADVMPKKG